MEQRWSKEAEFARSILNGTTDADRIAALEAEVAAKDAEIARLRAALDPRWFYADGYCSEDCHDSPDEVLEYLDLSPGNHIISIDCAGPLPSIWCAVRVLTPDEMDAQETDDCLSFTEHATEAEARAALEPSR